MTGRQAVWVAALTQERDRLEDDLDRERANHETLLRINQRAVEAAEAALAREKETSDGLYLTVQAQSRALADTRRALETFRDSYDIWRNGCDEAHLDLAYDAACRVLAATGGGTLSRKGELIEGMARLADDLDAGVVYWQDFPPDLVERFRSLLAGGGTGQEQQP